MGQEGQADQHGCLCTHTIYIRPFCMLGHGGQSPGVRLDEDVGFDMFSNCNLLTALRSQIDVGVRKSY